MSNDITKDNIELPNDSIRRSIDKIAKEHGFVRYELILSDGSKKGDNYIGIVFRIQVVGEKRDGKTGKLNLFCKVSPQNEARRKQFKASQVFIREAFVYTDIIPEFLKFQKKKGITEGGFEAYAKCFEVNTEHMKEYLIMEDLRDDGYLMFDRHTTVDFEHAKLVLQDLGKFHAFSFALKDQDGKTFKRLSNLEETFFTKPMDENFINYLKTLMAKTKSFFADVEGEYLKILDNIDKNFMDIFFETVDCDLADPYTVISHGDCWLNNLLFKYENGVPVKTCLLDWQIARYVSPILDLVFFIFVCTEKPLRDEHYDDLLRAYHDSLSKFLTRLGSDPEKLFPYSALQEQLKKFGKFGFCMGLMFVNVIIADSDDVPDMDEMAEKMSNDPEGNMEEFIAKNDKTEVLYQKRMSDMVKDMVRLGYI